MVCGTPEQGKLLSNLLHLLPPKKNLVFFGKRRMYPFRSHLV
jgi:hypothetical protein